MYKRLSKKREATEIVVQLLISIIIRRPGYFFTAILRKIIEGKL
jgi:hypothetical protein